MYQGGLNTFVVHHYDIGLTDLGPRICGCKWPKARPPSWRSNRSKTGRAGGFAEEFDSVEDAVTYLTPTEKQMIPQDGPPDPGSYKDGVDDLRYQMEKKLYDLVSNGA